jgi:hypothetical protein
MKSSKARPICPERRETRLMVMTPGGYTGLAPELAMQVMKPPIRVRPSRCTPAPGQPLGMPVRAAFLRDLLAEAPAADPRHVALPISRRRCRRTTWPASSCIEPYSLARLAIRHDRQTRPLARWRTVRSPRKRFASVLGQRTGPCWCRTWTAGIRDVRALLGLVGFLPRWRVDDVMISYAVRGRRRSARTSTSTTCSCCRDSASAAGSIDARSEPAEGLPRGRA